MDRLMFKIWVVFLLVGACKLNEPPDTRLPVITTSEVFEIKMTKAKGGGVISDEGGGPLTHRGICWSWNNPFPTLQDSLSIAGVGIGNFISQMASLYADRSYYVRAFGTNQFGTAYGDVKKFKTSSGCIEQSPWDVNWFTDDPTIKSLNGKWKVISFEDCDEQQAEFKTEENSWGYDIVVTFHDRDGIVILEASNTTNFIGGSFKYNGSRQIENVDCCFTTLILQPEWGNKFLTVFNCWRYLNISITTNRLRIFYCYNLKSVTFEKVD